MIDVVEVKRESEEVRGKFEDLLSECRPIRARHSSIEIMMKRWKENTKIYQKMIDKNQETNMKNTKIRSKAIKASKQNKQV